MRELIGGQTDRQTDRQARQTDRQARQTDRLCRQTDRQTDRREGGGRQTNR